MNWYFEQIKIIEECIADLREKPMSAADEIALESLKKRRDEMKIVIDEWLETKDR